MRAKWIIALVAVCCIVAVGVPLFGLYVMYSYQHYLVMQAVQESINNQPRHVYVKYVPVFLEDNKIYQDDNKPYVIIHDFTARDYRGNPPYSLQITGFAINDGGGIAYNAVLHVVAMTSEGIALDANHDFTGITPNASLKFSFSLKYNSSLPITNCTITPVYTDAS